MGYPPVSFKTPASALLSPSKHDFNVKIKSILTGDKSVNERDLGNGSTIYMYIKSLHGMF